MSNRDIQEIEVQVNDELADRVEITPNQALVSTSLLHTFVPLYKHCVDRAKDRPYQDLSLMQKKAH